MSISTFRFLEGFLGCLFLLAAFAKVVEPRALETLLMHGLRVKNRWAGIASRAVIGGEALLGALLLIGVVPAVTDAVAVLACCAFVATQTLLLNGRPCGCLGRFDRRTRKTVALGRAVLAVCVGIGAVVTRIVGNSFGVVRGTTGVKSSAFGALACVFVVLVLAAVVESVISGPRMPRRTARQAARLPQEVASQ
jgi:hypothetical protein